MNNIQNNEFECNYIKETVCKIDRLQKEIQVDTRGRCIGCETSLFTSLNNTIPVSFFTCIGNPVVGRVGTTLETTPFFRIESIRCNRFATLRLLTLEADVLTGTDFTTTIDLDCVSQIQCYEAVNVEVCSLDE